MRILLDTNVVLDVALERQPFFDDAFAVIDRARQPTAEMFVTASTVTDIYYVLAKGGRDKEARQFLRQFLSFVNVCPVDREPFFRRSTLISRTSRMPFNISLPKPFPDKRSLRATKMTSLIRRSKS